MGYNPTVDGAPAVGRVAVVAQAHRRWQKRKGYASQDKTFYGLFQQIAAKGDGGQGVGTPDVQGKFDRTTS